MEIQLINNTVFADYSELQVNDSIVNQITSHTAETWQPNRKTEERKNNTQQGKEAEEIVETFIKEQFNAKISLKSYDEIRNDDYEKHAPFDFLIWNSEEVDEKDIARIETSVKNDIEASQGKFVSLSECTRGLCRKSNVKIAEVKSTNIRDKLKEKAGFTGNYADIVSVEKLVDVIKKADDIFCYPHYKRSETGDNYSIDDYCCYVKTREPSLAEYDGDELREKVIELEAKKQCCDIFIRVYVDSGAKKGFVIGWMQRERLLDYKVVFKRMSQPGKSEKALYFTKNLSETESLMNIAEALEPNECVYASPYTTSNFYHRRRDCRFLADVKREDIIVFQSEKEAIDNKRYTQRCRNCFG